MALSIWQAFLELHFFTPDSSHLQDLGDQDALFLFETFWDSEVPRIGELGAQGWAAYVARGSPQMLTVESSYIPNVQANLSDTFRNWQITEEQHALQARRVDRMIDDSLEDDPFRVVFFSDISGLLLKLSGPRAKNTILQGFLAFCRLPPLSSSKPAPKTSIWWTDAFIRTEGLEGNDTYLRKMLQRRESDVSNNDRYALKANFDNTSNFYQRGLFSHFMGNFAISTDTLFANDLSWASCMDRWTKIYSDGEGPVELSWLRRVLRSLISTGAGGSDLAELYLAFEWTNSPER